MTTPTSAPAPQTGAPAPAQGAAPQEQGGGDIESQVAQWAQNPTPEQAMDILSQIAEQLGIPVGGAEQPAPEAPVEEAVPMQRNGGKVSVPAYKKGGGVKTTVQSQVDAYGDDNWLANALANKGLKLESVVPTHKQGAKVDTKKAEQKPAAQKSATQQPQAQQPAAQPAVAGVSERLSAKQPGTAAYGLEKAPASVTPALPGTAALPTPGTESSHPLIQGFLASRQKVQPAVAPVPALAPPVKK